MRTAVDYILKTLYEKLRTMYKETTTERAICRFHQSSEESVDYVRKVLYEEMRSVYKKITTESHVPFTLDSLLRAVDCEQQVL